MVYLLFDNIDFLGSGYSYAKWFGPIDLAIVLIGVKVADYYFQEVQARQVRAGRGASSTKASITRGCRVGLVGAARLKPVVRSRRPGPCAITLSDVMLLEVASEGGPR